MKRWMIFGVFALILLSSFVIAANPTDLPTAPSGAEVATSLKTASTSFREKLDDAVTYEVNVPNNLQIVARVLFGLKAGEVLSVQALVMMSAIWLMLLIMIYDILAVVPFLGSGFKSWLISVCVNLLIALGGGIRQISYFFLGIGDFFKFLGAFAILRLIISLAVVITITVLLTKLSTFVRHRLEIIEAEHTGEKLSLGAKFSEIFSTAARDIAQEEKKPRIDF